MFEEFKVTPEIGDTALLYDPKVPVGTIKSLAALDAQIKETAENQGILKGKFPRFPNISEFEIELANYNPLLLAFGILGRYKPTIVTKGYKNRPINRYLKYMHLRLLKNRSRSTVYWKTSLLVIRRSNAYLIGCLHMIDKNLYRTLTIKQLRHLLRKVDKLRGRVDGHFRHNMNFHRTYIPKGTDTFRPLGVPSLDWRIYSNMLLHPLVIYAQPGAQQHGFLPGRGTLTAWKQILKECINSQVIYEIDLKQCFPSISLPRLTYLMEEKYRVPKYIARFYETLNYSLPQFKGPLLLNEAQSIGILQSILYNKSQGFTLPVVRYDGVPEVSRISANNAYTHYYAGKYTNNPNKIEIDVNKMQIQQLTTIPAETLKAFLQSLSPLHHVTREVITTNVARCLNPLHKEATYQENVHEWCKLIGTAQGSPLSPYLSALALDEIAQALPSEFKVVQYADDMIFYGGSDLVNYIESGKLKDLLTSLGFVMHEEKSGFVKRVAWLKDLKFLGLIYDGIFDTLRSDTRKGAKLYYNKKSLLEAEYDIIQGETLSQTQLQMELNKATMRKMKYSNLAAEMVDDPKIAEHYHFMGGVNKNLEFYYRRLILLKDLFKSNRFLWDYYTFLSTFFSTYSEDLYQSLLTGVLGLRNRKALEAMLKRRFDDRGLLSYAPSIMFTIQRLTRDFFMSMYKFPQLFVPNDTTTSVFPWSLDSVYPWHKYRSLFLMESYNGYLNTYRNKYTWSNFINSRLSGMIISRLYNGNYNLDNLSQDFTFEVKPMSLGFFIKSSSNATIFTGSSLACNRMLSELSRIQNSKKYTSVRKSKAVSSVKVFDT